MEETWHVLTKDCWLGCFVFWPPCSTPHTAGKDPSKKLGKVERYSVKKSWYAAYICLVLIGYFLNNLLSEFLYAYQTSKKIFPLFKYSWYLIFCWGARRGCGGGGCNKILGIHNNTTKLPTKSQRKPKRWKINWSISASLQIFISKTPRGQAKWKIKMLWMDIFEKIDLCFGCKYVGFCGEEWMVLGVMGWKRQYKGFWQHAASAFNARASIYAATRGVRLYRVTHHCF